MDNTNWEKVGVTDPPRLLETRVLLHWAAQLPGAMGSSLVDPQSDDGHTTLTWDPAHRRFVSGTTGQGFRVGLVPETFALQFLDGQGSAPRELLLGGQTLKQAQDWLDATIRQATGQPPAAPILARDYDLPEHPVGEGAPFPEPDHDALRELAGWYGNAQARLEAVRTQGAPVRSAAAVRCWPHHFDIATLLTLDPDRDPETARSVGVGLSPGDGGTAEPYWYVTPWPHPPANDLPKLAGEGRWNTEGWVGALLPASAMSAAAGEQRTQAQAFLESAVAASLTLLTRSS
jgi:hypothetical protein